MPINPVPVRAEVTGGDAATAGSAWLEFFKSVFNALFGWKRTYTVVATHNFGSIAAGTDDNFLVTVTGAKVGDACLVSAGQFNNGLGIDGTVTATDTVTVRAFNFTASPINPASTTYRVIVFQQ